jgi:hypothetical protein
MGLLLLGGGGGAQYGLPEYGFSGHITKYPLTSRNFRENTKNFLGHQNFSEIFKFCPNFALLFARP